MYKLIKMSSPGWTREYESRADLAITLSRHVCEDCTLWYGDDIENMLSSPCGLEFDYVCPGDNDEPLTDVELLDAKMNGYKL